MTQHLKLEHGDIITVATADTPSTRVENITGNIIGIVDGEQDKTCFIFKNGDDLIRFYLDRDGRPATRLLILLCSRLTQLRTSRLEVTSLQGDSPGQSRLQLELRDTSERGIAPFRLPSNAYCLNGQRIAWIKATLEMVDSSTGAGSDTAPASDGNVVSSTAGDLAPHAPVVVDGISPADPSVTPVDARRVTLVRGFPLFCIVYDSCPDEDTGEGGDRITADNPLDTVRKIYAEGSVADVFSRNFVTAAERDAYLDGSRNAISGLDHRFVFFTTEREDVNACIQYQASRA